MHSINAFRYHLCSIATRALLLNTYVKFANLFPEIKPRIEAVLQQSSNIRNPDAELQQRSIEYLKLSQIATADVLATVLEEMPRKCHSHTAVRCVVSLQHSLRRSRPC